MDDADIAQQYEEASRQAAMQRTRHRMHYTGKCRNCEEVLPKKGTYFCDADCREDYEMREFRKTGKKI